MYILIFVFGTFVVLALMGACWLLWRALATIAQMDQLIVELDDFLREYDSRLRDAAKGDVLSNHPEVTDFVRLNKWALANVAAMLDVYGQQRASSGSKKEVEKLPRPDVV